MRDVHFHTSGERPRQYDPRFTRRFFAVLLAALVVFVAVFVVIV